MEREKNKYRLLLTMCLAAAICILGLTGCMDKGGVNMNGGKGQEEGAPEGTGPVQVSELLPQNLITVGFIQAGHESDWRVAATKCCMETFSEENGYRLYFVDADNNPRMQVDAVRNFIKDKVDYIVINPIVETGWMAALKEAYHAKIPVLVLDRKIDCDNRYYKAWFGSDFVQEGECAGCWLQSYLDSNGRNTEPVRIVAINGTPGSSAQLGRTEGFAKYLEQNENWELLAQDSGNFTEAGGRQVMQEYLDADMEMDVVICQNDSEAYGAMAVLDEAGITYGKGGDVIIISFDATKAGLEAVEQGKLNADFECNPFAPAYAAQAIQILESGGKLTKKENILEEECFTCEKKPAYIFTSAGMKKMTMVTSELRNNRDY